MSPETDVSERQLIIRLLSLANRSNDMRELIRNVTTLLKSWSGCDAVGIRLKQGDDFPYLVTQGMTDEFIQSENNLCSISGSGEKILDDDGLAVLECMCGSVIRGRMPEGSDLLTEFGSFWTNSTTRLLKTPGIKKLLPPTRNRCMAEGYESLALVPLKAEGKTFGLLQLCDTSTDCFTDELIGQCERLGQSVALLISQRQSQQSLHKREQEHRLLVDKAPFPIMIVRDGVFVHCNQAAAVILGYESPEALNGKEVVTAVSHDFHESFRQRMDALKDGGANEEIEVKIERSDGSTAIVLSTSIATTWGGEPAVLIFGYDMTARLEREEVEARERARLYSILDAIPVYTYLQTKEYNVKFGNERFRELFGDPGDRKCYEVFGKRTEPCVPCHTFEAFDTGKPIVREWTDKEGRTFEIHASHIPDAPEGPMVLETGIEVTERKKAEEAAVQQKKRYEALFLSSPVACYAWRKVDDDFVLDSYNERSAKETGGTIERLLGKRLSQVESIHSEIVADIHKCFETRQSIEHEMKYELRNRKGAIDFWLSYSYAPPDTVLVQTIDLTEKHRMEAELQKQDKLESLGVLAGGIAHDFNNILLAILGNVSLAKSLHANDSELVELLEEAEKATGRARQLTRQLLTFSEGGAPVKEATRLDNVVTEAAETAVRGSVCSCEFSVAKSLYTVNIDRIQVSQVVRNLVINAIEAMTNGGKVNVHIENYDLELSGNMPLIPGKYVKIRVVDTGVGIPEDNLKRLFDPFYTTKEMGAGLGLAICYSIVRQHGGYISVQSIESQGSTFTVYLPAFEGATAIADSDSVRIADGTGKVLIMDDEPSIRLVAQSILGRCGYTVVTAKDGDEAVAAWKAATDEGMGFDLAMLDLTVVDGMGGLETLQALKEIDPDAMAIVSSGYSNDPVLSEYELHGFCGCITKPYSAVQLTRLVDDILTRAKRTAGL